MRHGTLSGYKTDGCRCDECRTAVRIHTNRRRVERRAVAMKDKSCADCGKTESEVELHCHHIDPATKTTNMGWLWGASWRRIYEELAKCVILCGPCHHARHAAPCGTRSCYNAGCRCDDCRAASAAYMREYRARSL